MIAQGTPQMIPALSKIWATCFGDSPQYIDFFMERRFSTCQSFVWLENGEVVAGIYLLPCFLGSGPAFYSYAGGVLPQFRCRGIFEKLFFVSRDFCRERGAELTIVPAPGTEQYYLRRGYKPAFSFSQHIYEKTGKQIGLLFQEATAERYVQLRNQAFEKLDYVQWSRDAVQYALEENRFCGGFAKIIAAEQDYLIFGKKNGNTLEITETTLNPETAARFAPDLCQHWNTTQVSFRFPAVYGGDTVENGGVWWRETSLKNGWLGLDLT